MTIDITQTRKFNGCYFIENENSTEASFLQNELLFLTDEKKQLKKVIIAKINAAKESIKLCSFILTDKEIVCHLQKSITQNKVAVFILTQLDNNKINANFLTSEEFFEVKQSSDNIHLGYIKELFETGAHIRAAEDLHAKFLIFDRKEVLITSANITYHSLNANTEIGMFCKNDADIRKYDILFDLIYQHGTQYEKFASAGRNKQFISYTNKKIEEKWFPSTASGVLKYTYHNIENSIYSEILRIINESQKEIMLFTYSVVKLHKLPELTLAIKKAIERGVEIKLFCRAMNYRPDHLLGVSEFSQLNCQIFGDAYNHSKGILNESEGFIFTANIDGNHGLKNGFELGYKLTGDEYLIMKNFFDFKIKTSQSRLVKNPTKIDVLKWYRTYYEHKKMKNPLKESNYRISFGNSKTLKDLLVNNLIYIVFSNNKPTNLEVAGYCYRIYSFHGINIEIDTRPGRIIDLSNPKYVLPYNELIIESR